MAKQNMFIDFVSKYIENDPILRFDLKDNLARLEKQIEGDSAFYFLAIISFIEGYLRDTYKKLDCRFDFNNEESIKLSEMFKIAQDKISDVISGKTLSHTESIEIKYIFNLMRKSSNQEGRYNKEIDEYVVTKAPTEFYISGDRIRHCFCKQDNDNVRFLVERFVEFSKIYGFYTEYKEEINKHLESYYFVPLKQHESEDHSRQDEKAKELIKMMNKGSDEDKKKASENFDEVQTERALYAKTWRDYQKIISELTEEQNAISDELLEKINKSKSIKRLIKGGPGTGKTLILINVLQETLDKDIKLLTYTKSLTNYNKYLSNLISFNGKKLSSEDKKNVSDRILGFDDYFISIAEKLFNKKIISLNSVSDVEGICNKYNVGQEELFNEAREIWLHLPEVKKYLDHTYSQKNPVDKSEQDKRRKFWNAVAELDKDIEEHSDIPLEWALYKIYKKIKPIPDALKCDYLLIDEIQDLEAAKIEAIKQMSRKGYVFAGDKTQSVFVRKGLPWTWLTKREFSTTKEELSKNFRSTKPIQDLANDYRNVILLKDPESRSIGFMPGPIPEAYISSERTVVIEKLLERIKFMKEQLFFDNGEFCIVAANDTTLTKIKDELTKQGIESKFIEKGEYDFEKDKDLIKLSKIKYVKGIDIPVILLVLDEDFIDKTKNDDMDIYSQENSIYTCISRAMNILNVFFINNGKLLTPSEDKKKKNAVLKLYETMKDNIIELKTK